MRLTDLSDLAGWDEFVCRVEGGTIYHHSSWLRALARTYGFRPRLLALEDNAGEIEGVLPAFLVDSPITGRRLVSLPYTNAAGPLCRPGVDAAPLLASAIDLARAERCQYLEVRGQPGWDRLADPGLERLERYHCHVLRLNGDPESTRAGFDKRARRGIARAARSGVRVRFGGGQADVSEFYRLNLLTRRKHGVPPQPLAFFTALWEELRPGGAVEVLLAERERAVIAGLVLLAFRDTVVYAYGASDERFLRHAPNHALFDAAIGWTAEHGYRAFDFGRTAPENEGLMEFKRQWGGEPAPLDYYYWPQVRGFVSASESGLKHRLFAAAWRRLPLVATGLIGPTLYRHLA